MVWHYRLGHPSFSYLKNPFLVLIKKVDPSSFQCESRLLNKSQRKPYIPKPYYALKPFYLFHSDVSGKKWFVTFIDNHTRLCL